MTKNKELKKIYLKYLNNKDINAISIFINDIAELVNKNETET